MEELPFVSIKSIRFNRAESAGVVIPVPDGGAELLIAMFTIRSVEVFVFAVECSRLVARLKVRYAVVGLYHTLFCPMQAGGVLCAACLVHES